VDSETDQQIYIDNNKLLSIYKTRDFTSRSHIKLLIGTIIAYICKNIIILNMGYLYAYTSARGVGI